jgi:hypothetical protein
MATVLGIVDTPYDVARSVGCILYGIHGYTTPVEMHPRGPKDQSTLGTNNPIPSTLPFLQGGQILSHLQLSGTKDFCTATNPLRPQIPTSQSLHGCRSCDVAARTLHFHHPSIGWALKELFCRRSPCQKRQGSI